MIKILKLAHSISEMVTRSGCTAEEGLAACKVCIAQLDHLPAERLAAADSLAVEALKLMKQVS